MDPAKEAILIDALNNRMLFGALSNLRLAPHVREGRAGAPSPAVEDSPAVRGPKAPRPSGGASPVDGKNLPASGSPSAGATEERLSLSPAAWAALRDESAAAPATFQAESYGRTGALGVEASVLPLSSADPSSAAAAMALAARAYGDDFRSGAAVSTTAAATSSAPTRLSSLGILRA